MWTPLLQNAIFFLKWHVTEQETNLCISVRIMSFTRPEGLDVVSLTEFCFTYFSFGKRGIKEAHPASRNAVLQLVKPRQ